MNENEQEKQAATPQVHQEQQAREDENKNIENHQTPPAELPAQNRIEHPQRQLG